MVPLKSVWQLHAAHAALSRTAQAGSLLVQTPVTWVFMLMVSLQHSTHFLLKKGFELTSYTFTDDRAFYPTPKNSVNLILYRKRISPLCIR